MTGSLVLRTSLLALAAVAALAIFSAALARPGEMDFVAQYAGARLVATGRGDLVLDQAAVLAAEREAVPERAVILPFVQPPAVALLLSPLGLLPFGTAFALMAAIDATLIVAALLLLSCRRAPLEPLTLLLAPPAAVAIAHGQTSPLILVLVAIAHRAGPFAAGFALGLTTLRPQTAPLLLIAAAGDRRRIAGAAAGVLAVVAGSAAVVGLEGLPRYSLALLDAGRWSLSGEHGLRSGFGWSGLSGALGVPPLGLVAAVLGLALGAAAVIRSHRRTRVAVAAAWSLIASPHVLLHDALLAYPALLLPGSIAGVRARIASAVLVPLAHLLVVPAGVLWSAAVAIWAAQPRPPRPDGPSVRGPVRRDP